MGGRHASTAQRQGPGEFIRDHLQDPQTGGRNYVGAMYQAYKGHLRRRSTQAPLPPRPPQVHLAPERDRRHHLRRRGGNLLGISPPRDLPQDYGPPCGMPAPRHYHRVLDSQNLAFDKPEAVWKQKRGLSPAQPAPSPVQLRVVTQPITPTPSRITPPAPTELVLRWVAVPPLRRPARRGAKRLVTHLRPLPRLVGVGPETPEVDRELERLEGKLQSRVDELEEAVGKEEDKEEPNEDRLRDYSGLSLPEASPLPRRRRRRKIEDEEE